MNLTLMSLSLFARPVQSAGAYACPTLPGGRVQGPVPPQPFLSSLRAVGRSVGTRHCPWSLEVKPGQRINLTAYSFGWGGGEVGEDGEEEEAPAPPVGDCLVVVEEGGRTRKFQVCDLSLSRVHSLYVSENQAIKVYFDIQRLDSSRPNILLEYNGEQRRGL